MPKFNKNVDELETRFDKWLYIIKNLSQLDKITETLRESIFEKLFKTAEIAKFTPTQVRSYENSLKYYRDLKNSLDTAKEEGMLEGMKVEKIEIAKKLLKIGNLSTVETSSITGLSEEIVKSLLTE